MASPSSAPVVVEKISAPDFTSPMPPSVSANSNGLNQATVTASVPDNGTALTFFRVVPTLSIPGVTLTPICGNEVQITTDAPQIDGNELPLWIAFSRQIGTQSGTLLAPFSQSSSRTFLDRGFNDQLPPSDLLTYGVCVKDSFNREACNLASTNIGNPHPAQLFCNGACLNVASDAQNCGGCGAVCDPFGAGTCNAGVCTCPSGFTACARNDITYCECGTCGQECNGGTCSNGSCTCPSGYTLCNGTCENLSNENTHCGSCNTVCSAFGGLVCVNGKCACPNDSTLCGGRCVDVTLDSNNCGRCGHRCPRGAGCDNGTCSPIN